MPLRLAVKRLSAVETDPSRSHQHEFHAGRLRRELELPEERTSGTLTCLILGRDRDQAVVDEDQFTLYDARADNPSRAAEWRLFYASQVIPELAREGDLLVLYRHGPGLHALVAPAGSKAEVDLLRALEIGDEAVRSQFSFLDAPEPELRDVGEVINQLTLPEDVSVEYQVSDHALFRRAIKDGHLPSSAEMAIAAAEIIGSHGGPTADPDTYLFAALEAETDLYFGIENNIQTIKLDELLARGPDLANVIDFAMSVQQSRRSRRGQSLQNHFAQVLRTNGIPFGAQCATERGETPDFIVPGCPQYHDQGVGGDRLRVVACKSTAKERWRQVLNEAARIPDKYLLTLDRGLTATTVEAMNAARVEVFLPLPIIEESYSGASSRPSLRTVAELIANLQSIA